MDLCKRKSNNSNTNSNKSKNSNRRKRRYNSSVDFLNNSDGISPCNKQPKISHSSPFYATFKRFNSNDNDDGNDNYYNELPLRNITETPITTTSESPSTLSKYAPFRAVEGPSTSRKSSLTYKNNDNSASNTSTTNTGSRKRRLSSSTNNSDPGFDLEPTAKRVQQQNSPSSPLLQYEKNSTSSVVVSPLSSDPSYFSLQPESDKEDDEEEIEEEQHNKNVYTISPSLLTSSTTRLLVHNDRTACINENVNANDMDNNIGRGNNCNGNHSNTDIDDNDDDNNSEISSEWSTYSSLSNTDNENTLKYLDGSNVTVTTAYHGQRTPGQPVSPIHITSKDSGALDKNKLQSLNKSLHCEEFHCLTPLAADIEPARQCPLPALAWANAHDVWQLMCRKDELAAALRDPNMMDDHPSLQSRMRAILLDWLIEVCEVYKLHRETYYLAVDYLDRYLSIQKNVQKTHLQLIGITCLFVAAKVEEIYPPKIGEFAYVTDGACCEDDILKYEILLLKALQWNINPITPIGWLGVYMQLKVTNRTPASFNNVIANNRNKDNHLNMSATCSHKKSENIAKSSQKAGDSTSDLPPDVDKAFIYPQFSSFEFVQTAQLLDLCSLDIEMNRFSYSVLAASALSLTFNKEVAIRCSGLDWQSIKPCAEWMEPFFQVTSKQSHTLHVLEQNDNISTRYGLGHICPNIVTDDSHTTQTHTVSMTMFDHVCLLQEQILAIKIKHEASPANALICPRGLLTPPASDRKTLTIDVKDGNTVHI